MAVFNVKTFGAVGDLVTDDFPAFQKALDAVDSFTAIPGRQNSGGVLLIPAGEYQLTQPLVVKHGTILQGEGSAASLLLFANSPGLASNETTSGVIFGVNAGGASIRDLTLWTDKRFHPGGTVPPIVSDDDPFFGFTAPITGVSTIGRFFEIAGDHVSEFPVGGSLAVLNSTGNNRPTLAVSSPYTISASALDGSNTRVTVVETVPSGIADGDVTVPAAKSRTGIVLASGIDVRPSSVSIENCVIIGFQHDGIHISNPFGAGPYQWGVRNCDIGQNGRHGLFVTGAIGCAVRVHCIGNRKYGFYNAVHANSYVACTTQSNGLSAQPPAPGFGGQYWMGGVGATSVLLGAQDDGGAPSVAAAPTVVVGGQISALTPVADIWGRWPTIVYQQGDMAAYGIRSSGVKAITNNYALVKNDTMILADSHANPPNLILTLPDLTDPEESKRLLGYQVTVKKTNVAGPDVIIEPLSATIDGDSHVTLTSQYSWVTLLWGPEGSPSWHIIGRS
jgi:hypothetical protein